MRGTGRWLDVWAAATLAPAAPVFILAFVLGGAALPYAPGLVARTRGVVTVRSRYQEGVPRWFHRRLGWFGAALLVGRAVADLGASPFWPPGFRLGCPHWSLVETEPTRLAVRLRLAPMGDDELGLVTGGYSELAINHDAVYESAPLMRAALDRLSMGEERETWETRERGRR